MKKFEIVYKMITTHKAFVKASSADEAEDLLRKGGAYEVVFPFPNEANNLIIDAIAEIDEFPELHRLGNRKDKVIL